LHAFGIVRIFRSKQDERSGGFAIREGHIDVVKTLLKAGVDVNEVVPNGGGPRGGYGGRGPKRKEETTYAYEDEDQSAGGVRVGCTRHLLPDASPHRARSSGSRASR